MSRDDIAFWQSHMRHISKIINCNLLTYEFKIDNSRYAQFIAEHYLEQTGFYSINKLKLVKLLHCNILNIILNGELDKIKKIITNYQTAKYCNTLEISILHIANVIGSEINVLK